MYNKISSMLDQYKLKGMAWRVVLSHLRKDIFSTRYAAPVEQSIQELKQSDPSKHDRIEGLVEETYGDDLQSISNPKPKEMLKSWLIIQGAIQGEEALKSFLSRHPDLIKDGDLSRVQRALGKIRDDSYSIKQLESQIGVDGGKSETPQKVGASGTVLRGLQKVLYFDGLMAKDTRREDAEVYDKPGELKERNKNREQERDRLKSLIQKHEKQLSDLTKGLNKKVSESVQNYFLWRAYKGEDIVEFFNKHPDFLFKGDTKEDRKYLEATIKKMGDHILKQDFSLEDLERLLYPEVWEERQDGSRVSKNQHYKDLNVPGMPGGMKWVLITDKDGNSLSVCEGESRAMGHCGRSGLGSEGELLSLRDSSGASHITVDRIRSSKTLIQLKFHGNRAVSNYPGSVKYIEAIRPLLLSDEIKRLSSMDFDLKDLFDVKELEDIVSKKPEMATEADKVFLDIKKSGKYDREDLIEKFEGGDLTLRDVDGLSKNFEGKKMFVEDEILSYIKRGRLKLTLIGMFFSDIDYITEEVQKVALESQKGAYKDIIKLSELNVNALEGKLLLDEAHKVLLSSIESIGWSSGIEGLPENYVNKLLEEWDDGTKQSVLKGIKSMGWDDGTRELPDAYKKDLLKEEWDDGTKQSVLKGIESRGWYESTEGLSDAYKKGLLKEEWDDGTKQSLLKGIESVGWGNSTYDLPEENVNKLLEEWGDGIKQSILKGIESRGWYESTRDLPEDYKKDLLKDKWETEYKQHFLNRIKSSGWYDGTRGLPKDYREKLLGDKWETEYEQLEDKWETEYKQYFLNLIYDYNEGWYEGTLALPEDYKEKLLEEVWDTGYKQHLLNLIDYYGWHVTRGLPDKYINKLLEEDPSLKKYLK